MTEEEAERIARARFTVLAVLRAAGVVDMVAGIIIWKSDLLHRGGWPQLGLPIFVLGFAVSLLVPPLLARLWRGRR